MQTKTEFIMTALGGLLIGASGMMFAAQHFNQAADSTRREAGYRDITINVNDGLDRALEKISWDLATSFHDAGTRDENGASFAILSNDRERQDGLFSARFDNAFVMSFGRMLKNDDGTSFRDTPGQSRLLKPEGTFVIARPAAENAPGP